MAIFLIMIVLCRFLLDNTVDFILSRKSWRPDTRCQSWSEAGKTSSSGLKWTESTALQQASLQDVDSGAVEFLGLGEEDLFRRSAGRSTAAVQGGSDCLLHVFQISRTTRGKLTDRLLIFPRNDQICRFISKENVSFRVIRFIYLFSPSCKRVFLHKQRQTSPA